MARIRTIKPNFWDHPALPQLSLAARLLYISLWNFTDDLGVIPASTITIRSKVFPNEEIRSPRIKKWLAELIKAGFLFPISYQEKDFLYNDYFIKNQLIRQPNHHDVNIPEEQLLDILSSNPNFSISNYTSITHPLHTIKESSVEESIVKDKRRKDLKEENSPEGEEKKTDFESFSNWIKENTPFIATMPIQIDEKEFYALRQQFTSEQMVEILRDMDNCRNISRRYTSVYRTFLNWIKKQQP